jgi:hypothetical protein
MAVPKDQHDLVDDQEVQLPNESCFTSDGTYSYLNRNQTQKRIRAITVIDSMVTNPAYKDME